MSVTNSNACLNCGGVPEPGSPRGLCSRCLMARLLDVTDDPSAVDDEAPGLAEYEVLRPVAEGGMGRIVEAHDARLGRTVAMKILHDDLADGARAQDRFHREAAVLARLEHPNIVPIHALGRDADDRPFYTMKLVRGETLRSILDRLRKGGAGRGYSLNELLGVFNKICDAVAFAHSRGVIHRDLKPENVMVGRFGEVLVMDWGLAKVVGEPDLESESGIHDLDDADLRDLAGGLTLDGAVMGTPQFMSPEQAAGCSLQQDERSDVFSLGAILYSILTLRPPVRGRSVEEVLAKVRSGDIAPPTSYNTSSQPAAGAASLEESTARLVNTKGLPHCPGGRVPEALSAVTMRAMSVAAADRYAEVAGLQADVTAYLGGFATSVEQVGALGQLWLLIKRHRVVSGLIGVVAVISIAFTIRLAASEREARRHAETAESEAGNARAAEARARAEQESTRLALAKAQIALADGAYRRRDGNEMRRRLAECPEDLRDDTWRYLSAASSFGVRPIPAMNNRSIWSVARVPGHTGVFLTADKEGFVWEIDATGGRTRKRFRLAERGRIHLSLSSTGERLLVARESSSRYRIVNAATGEELSVGTVAEQSIQEVVFLPDGDSILVRSTAAGTLRRISAADGKVIWSIHSTARNLQVDREARWVTVQASPRTTVALARISDGQIEKRFSHPELGQMLGHCFSPDGSRLVTGDMTGNVFAWNVGNGQLVGRVRLGDTRALPVHVSRSGQVITLCNPPILGERMSLTVFHLETGELVAGMADISANTPRACMDGETGDVLLAGMSPVLCRFGVDRESAIISGRRVPAEVAFLDETSLFAGADDNAMTRQHLSATDGATTVWKGLDRSYVKVAVSPGSPRAVVIDKKANQRHLLHVFEPGTPAPPPKTIPYDWKRSDIAMTPDGESVYQLVGKAVLQRFDIGSGETVTIGPTDQRDIRFLRLADAGRVAIFGAKGMRENGREQDRLTSWSLSPTFQKRGTATVDFAIRDLAIDAAGSRLAVVGRNLSVHLFDAVTLEPAGRFRAHDETVTCVAFHPTLPILATGSADLHVKLWDWRTGRLLEQFIGPSQEPVDLAFSPSGRQLAAGCADKTTRVWSVADVPVE